MVARAETGREFIDDVYGTDARQEFGPGGVFRGFRVRLDKAAAGHLAALLSEADSTVPPRRYGLAATRENFRRLRVVRGGLPKYEQSAAREYVRGDVLHVTGSEKSCNIAISAIGAAMIAEKLRAATARAQEWIELRVRVVHRRREGHRSLMEFVPDVELVARAEDRGFGELGAALTGESWPADDFSDWERQGA